MSTASPTSRSLQLLRSRGLIAEKTEQRLPCSKFVTRDLFNVFDIVAVGGGVVAGVQVTTRSNQAARLKKVLAEPAVREWLRVSGARVFIHGWGRVGARGKAKRWACSEHEVVLADLPLPDAPAGDAQDDAEGQWANANEDAAGASMGDPGGTRDDD